MKSFLTILILLISFLGVSQPIVNRAGAANTVADYRLQAIYNLYVPRYIDTTAANVPYSPPPGGPASGPLGLDSCGAIIFTYDINNFWARACNPKRWVRVSADQILPDGVYAGGNVAYTGTNLDFIETAANYVLNGVIHMSSTATVTLDPSDPTYGRIDLIGLGINGDTVITGVPGASPQEPSYDPLSFIRRAAVLVAAGATTPSGITQFSVYDEDLGLPDEWTPSSVNATIDFANKNFPYHLTISSFVSVFDYTSQMNFTYSDTVHTYNKGTFLQFIRLNSSLPQTADFDVQLTLAGVAVSPLVSFSQNGMNRNLPSQYQPVFIPFPLFGAGDIVFDGFRIVATGSGALPTFYYDYAQMQNGLTSTPSQILFGVGDNNATSNRLFNQNGFNFNFTNGKIALNTATSPVHSLTIGDEVGGNPEVYLYAPDGQNVVLQPVNATSALTLNGQGLIYLRPNQLGGSGHVQIDDVPSQYITQSFYSGGQTSIGDIGIAILEAGVSNEFFLKPVSGGFPTYLDLYGPIKLMGITDQSSPDSIVTIKDNVVSRTAVSALIAGGGNANVGSGFRLANFGTFNINTITRTNGVLIDTSVANQLMFQVDSSIYATKAFVSSVAGGGGFTGVTSVSAVNSNGFSFSISNPTTTPQITLSTSVTSGQALYSTGTAIAGSANYTWDNTNQRLNIGGGAAVAYLGLHASTTTQASLNLGNAGTAPTSPNNADVWVASNHLNVRLNGVTYQLDQQASAGVSSITGTTNQVIASASTGAVTLSLPQSIATSSAVTFGRLTVGGIASNAPITFVANALPTAAAGRFGYDGTNILFSPATTFKRFALTNNVTPSNGQIPIGNGTDYTVSAISPSNNSMVITNGAGSITVGLNMTPQTLTDGATITWNAANGFNAVVTLGGTGRTLARSNWVAGATYTIKIIQGTGGNKTISVWPSGVRWPGGTVPTLSTAAGAIDMVSFYYDGTSCLGAFNTDYR